jgi:hypothetical protein
MNLGPELAKYDDTAEPITPDEVAGRLRRRKRIRLIGRASALGVIVVAVVVAATLRPTGERTTERASDQSATHLADLSWESILSSASSDGPRGNLLFSASATDELFFLASSGTEPAPELWTWSPDRLWTEQPRPPLDASDTPTAIGVQPSAARVAIIVQAADGSSRSIVRTRSQDWLVGPSESGLNGGFVDAVHFDGSRWHAVGNIRAGETIMPAAWESMDGLMWVPIPVTSSEEAEGDLETTAGGMRSITMADGTGRLVAVGRIGSRATSWSREVGGDWIESWRSASTGNAVMLSVATAGTPTAAGTKDGRVAVWTEDEDGRWNVVYQGELAGDVGLESVAAFRSEAIAAGELLADGGGRDPTLVVGKGSSWRVATSSISDPRPAALREVHSAEFGVVVVGSDVSGAEAVWLGRQANN